MACFSPFHRSWARSWINRSGLWRMASATLDLRLPSQQHGITSRVASPTPQRLRQHCSLVSICCISITLHYLSIFFTSVWNMRALLSGLKCKRLRQSSYDANVTIYTCCCGMHRVNLQQAVSADSYLLNTSDRENVCRPRREVKACSQHMNWTQLTSDKSTQLNNAFTGQARRRTT